MATILGITVSSMARGFERIANQEGTQKVLERDADKLIEKARFIYLRRAKHPNTVAPFYASSFSKKMTQLKKMKGWRVSNTDPTWIWIEFGAHAGGRTPILKYRPMGRAIDEMSGGIHND